MYIKYRLFCILCNEVVFVVKSIFIAVLFILAILGICEFLYFLRSLFAYPGIRTNNYTIIVLKEKFAIKQLNFLWQKLSWYGNDFSCGIIAITDFIDDDEIILCNDFCVGKNIFLCDLNSLSQCSLITQGESLNGSR